MSAPKGKYAWTATVGEKGQIVIPKQAREVFGIKPGDTLLLKKNVVVLDSLRNNKDDLIDQTVACLTNW